MRSLKLAAVQLSIVMLTGCISLDPHPSAAQAEADAASKAFKDRQAKPPVFSLVRDTVMDKLHFPVAGPGLLLLSQPRPTAADHVIVPAGTRLKFVGIERYVNPESDRRYVVMKFLDGPYRGKAVDARLVEWLPGFIEPDMEPWTGGPDRPVWDRSVEEQH
jgi:hypothetical protein